MKLYALQLQHTAHFSHLQLNINPDAAVVVFLSEQGTGKSTLLKHIYQALTWFQGRYKDLRSAGVVMLDQDIQQGFSQAKVNIAICIPEELHQLATEQNTELNPPSNIYRWEMTKTITQGETSLSQVDTKQLEQLVALYQKALRHDPQQGLPLLAYYPSDRFINDVNLLNKNNPLIFQANYAYDLAAIPITTFVRFFEWLREIHDIENAQNTQFLNSLLQQHQPNEERFLQSLYADAARLNPSLMALKNSLKIVVPEVEDLFLQYQPKLQLQVKIHGQVLNYQQLSHSLKVWLALVGDICRRMCLLNPHSLYPCTEGDGILIIDQIDQNLDEHHCTEILPRLQQAFPRLQIIASGTQMGLVENGLNYQCYCIEQQKLFELAIPSQHTQQKYHDIYSQILQGAEAQTNILYEIQPPEPVHQYLEQIQNQLNLEQQQQLIALLQNGLTETAKQSLNE